MTLFEVIVLSLLQGALELFPVSSLGHTVLIPALLGWNADRTDPSFLALVVMLHFGTATALLAFFWRDWLAITVGVLRSLVRRRLSDDPDERLGWLILIGSVVPGFFGVVLKDAVGGLLGRASIVAFFLIVNGLVMLAGERVRARTTDEEGLRLGELPFRTGFIVGASQALALIPGFSRAGVSMVAGLQARLDHVGAARFSFLLATPLIVGATMISVEDLFAPEALVAPSHVLIGYLISVATALISLKFMMRFFETERLDIFGYYCIVVGAAALAILGVGGTL